MAHYLCHLTIFILHLHHRHPPRKIDLRGLTNHQNPDLSIYLSLFFCAIVFYCRQINCCFAWVNEFKIK
jgi:hypothetical protein